MKALKIRTIIKIKAKEGLTMPVYARHFGFTIIELMITIAVIAVIASIAAPSFADLVERNKITGAAEAIKAELQLARSEAVKQSCNTTLAFTAGNAWLTTLTRCDGTTKVLNATSSSVTLPATTFTDNNVVFQFRRGDADENNAGVTLQTDNYSLQVRVVNSRVIDICSPAGARTIIGLGACA